MERRIRRWQKVSEMRVPAVSFIDSILLPHLFILRLAWLAYFQGAFTRDYLSDSRALSMTQASVGLGDPSFRPILRVAPRPKPPRAYCPFIPQALHSRFYIFSCRSVSSERLFFLRQSFTNCTIYSLLSWTWGAICS
jgi:hypothetical protein